MKSRRRFLQQSAATMALLGLPSISRRAISNDGVAVSDRHYQVVDVKRTTAKLEFRPVPARNMDREIPHWRFTEFCEVKLRSGVTGVGETLLFYTWGVPSDAAVKSVIGKSAIEVMWDDDLGAGLQMALFDAVGRTAGVPVHALLGKKLHQKTPLSWWNIDTSAEDMASECRLAMEQGYMSYKTKGRPWIDEHHMVNEAVKVVPDNFKIDMDFNGTLIDAERGIPILKALSKHPQVDIYETPIPQLDVQGNAKIVAATDVNIAMHYDKPDPAVCVRSRCCDGFVVGHGATDLMSAGHFCQEVEMPFWLQLVGSGLTAAWSLQFGGVLEQALWPAVNCHQLYETDLLTQPIVVKRGSATVPDRPGIGYEIDRDALAKLTTQRPRRRPEPQRLIETTWPDGRRMYTANDGTVNFMLRAGNEGKYPYYEDGAETRLVPNDGTAAWREIYREARKRGPIRR